MSKFTVTPVESFETDDGRRHNTMEDALKYNAGRQLIEQLEEDMYSGIDPSELAQKLVTNRRIYISILRAWDPRESKEQPEKDI
jgi:hypothetical protein